MAKFSQSNRLMEIKTPLGPDVLLLTSITGQEAISQLFTLQLELLAERGTKIAFDKLIGQNVTIRVNYAEGKSRYFNGIISRFSQGGRDEVFTQYRAEVVPLFWLLTKRVQSRVFQHLSVPEILKQVLGGLKISWEIHDKYEPRNYCVQYRESDFTFASRLMEEEGIYYYFKHADGSHELVLTDVPNKHPDVPDQSTVRYEEVAGVQRPELRVSSWEKTQELRSGKYTLWDHCFELPGKRLEAERKILDSVTVGTTTHSLKVGGNDKLEIYDYPGGYAQRFDGVDKAGTPQPAELQKIYDDNKRTVRLRMEQEQLPSLEIQGSSDCGQFAPGHQFKLERHFDADGSYLLTGVQHVARLGGNYRSGEDAWLEYSNEFTAIPAELPYRPPQVTPRPTVDGSQTATVVGPAGEKIFCDKYGRVKVQFHWDRYGKWDADSSCWLRVTQVWAGGGFGAIAIPRIGDEVIVDFLEGNPDRPIIVGCVYNAEKMPPFILPDYRMFSGLKSSSVDGHPRKNFSGLSFNDSTGDERVALYAEKDMMLNAENDHRHHVGNYQHAKIGRKSLTVVGSIPGIGGGSGGGGGSGAGGGGATGTTQEGDTVKDGQITSIGQPQPPQPPQPTDATGQQGTDPSYGNWKTSDGKLAAVPGFSGGTVYGINSQDTVGFMHQITIGQATQMVLDPISAWGYLPSTGQVHAGSIASEFLSLGGNQQLYWGTNYQSTYGPNINYTYAAQLDITAKPSKLTTVMADLLPLLCIIYEATYAGMTADERADICFASFAALAVAGVGVLVASQKADKAAKITEDIATYGKEATAVNAALGLATSPLASTFPTTLVQHVAATKQVATQALLNQAPPLNDADSAHSVNFVDGVMLQVANHMQLIARSDPTADPPSKDPSTILISSAGDGTNGVVFVNATKGMTLTSGGGLVELDFKDATSGDFTVHCGPKGTITLNNLPEQAQPQMIQMSPGSIMIDGGLAPQPGKIQLQVNKGVCSITLDPNPPPAGKLTLQCGPNKIELTQDAVTIDGINLQTEFMKIDQSALTISETSKVQKQMQTQIEKLQSTLAQLQRTMGMHQ